MAEELVRVTSDLRGTLQGVGFRPTLRRLVAEAGLGGWVQNRSGTVRLSLTGPRTAIDRFFDELPARLPPRARLDEMGPPTVEHLSPDASLGSFEIRESEGDGDFRVSIPADLAMCPACRADVQNRGSRYFGYPFTTCTDCGPRYTVVEAMPYDRERTALKAFPLCEACHAEYTDPHSRRFHAESIACPACGPRLWLADDAGQPRGGDPLRTSRAALAEGRIVAVRGLGGFLLALNAYDEEALVRLRARKHRPHQPFAVMARDLDVARKLCEVPEAAAELLTSPQAPIVILSPRPEAEEHLPMEALSPDTATLGVMLPTTPLHMLLFEPLPGDPTPPFELLIMTSGNRRGEPICTANEEAFQRLDGIADLFLCHDRDIHLRNDDSLAAVVEGAPQVWRRARGFAPDKVRLIHPVARTVLAMGAELKNTIALAWDREVVLSPHIGDLETPEALDGLEQVVARFPKYFRRPPEAVAVDLHPDMHATRLGRRVANELGVPVVEVQHHHAHAAAAMAEHGLTKALGLVFDGTGLGSDGTIWGAELLHVEPHGFERLATFAPVPLPGGDTAVRRPGRQVVARWLAAGLEPESSWARLLGLGPEELEVLRLQCARGLNAPPTHAAGRLFDAYAAWLGVAPAEVSWEAQAPVRLEALAGAGRAGTVEVPFVVRHTDGLMEVDWSPTFTAAAEGRPPENRRADHAAAFHVAVADAAAAMAQHGRDQTGADDVVLSGGVWMNRRLTSLACARLEKQGFRVYVHRSVPPNDGGLALGQAVVGGANSQGAG